MSVRLAPVGWTRGKLLYDLVLGAAVLLYLLAYARLAPLLGEDRVDGPTRLMGAYGTCAFLLFSAALAIGPLARLAPGRFLPLLHNRRHLGVVTALVALSHAIEVLGWHFAYGRVPMLQAMLGAEPALAALPGLPFVPFGVFALAVLLLLAATSHDFWLEFLSPPLWKAIHLLAYPAYASAVAHVALGRLQDPGGAALAGFVVTLALAVAALHALAAWRDTARRRAAAAPEGWIAAGRPADIAEGRAIEVRLPNGDPVAIFRHEGRLSAVFGLCAHQNGPLAEGRVLDGCITCPWHGWQYRPDDGCSPPPFQERIATFNLRLEGGRLWLDPRPNPPGTRVAPLPVPGPIPVAADGADFYIGWAAVPPVLLPWLRGLAFALPAAALALGLALGLANGDHEPARFAAGPASPGFADLPEPAALEGTLLADPLPLLHLPADAAHPRGRTLLLARDGKEGAGDLSALDGARVRAEGALLRRGSLGMLVLSAPPVRLDGPGAKPEREALGRWRIAGEICDGKCASGAMLPATGLAHRACAALCLDGDIPAVFVPFAPVQGHGFLILADAAGGPALPALRPLVGVPVTLTGALERRGDALVFRADPP